jgi:hypothetical protein
MFFMQVPKTMQVGDSHACRINGQAATVTWRGTDTLTIEPGDDRPILSTFIDGEYRVFMCGHAGDGKYRTEEASGGVVVSDLTPIE